MRRLIAAGIMLALMLACSWRISAHQEPTPAESSTVTDEGDPALTKWAWREEVQLPATKNALCAIILPPSVLGKARADLADLRVADAEGKRIPFALRELRTKYIQQAVPIIKEYDQGPIEAKGYYEVSLELGDIGQFGHNEIEIETTGKDFRRKVEVMGDNKPNFAEARQLLDKDKYIVHYEVEGTIIDLRRLRYAPNKVRFLKVRVYADPSIAERIPKIDKVSVRYAEAIKGQEVTHAASLDDRQPDRASGGPGSAWFIDLGPEAVPCDKLTLWVAGPPVERPFRVDVVDRDNEQRFVATRNWTWRKDGDRLWLDIDFSHEVRAKRIRLVITDYANAPLNIMGVQYSAAARQVIFAPPEPAKYKAPLYLYCGNPDASPANYDFARQLAATLTPAPQKVALIGMQQNPRYVPPSPSLPEQMPWLIYTILGLTSLALLAILVVLARTAIGRHDATKALV